MSDTAISSTVGAHGRNGVTVTAVIPTQTNDATHVCKNPDQGRIRVKDAQGLEYTTVPTYTVDGITFIKEAQ